MAAARDEQQPQFGTARGRDRPKSAATALGGDHPTVRGGAAIVAVLRNSPLREIEIERFSARVPARDVEL